MNNYESEQYANIVRWQNEEPSVVSQAVGFALKPITGLVNFVIPKKALEGALSAADKMAEWFTDESDIIRDANVNSISELQSKDLKLSDQLAKNVKQWAVGVSAGEGGVAGAVGLPGLAADIPFVITHSLRTIHKIGLCYGFKAVTPQDQHFIFQIMSAAGSNTMKEKTVALVCLRQLQVMIAQKSWKAIGEKAVVNQFGKEALVTAIRALAKQLGINLTKRKALQAIPIFGGGIAAAVNAAFMNDICNAAIYCFQEYWLRSNNKLIES